MSDSRAPWACANCDQPLGGGSPVLPVHVSDDGGDGAGKAERWCPPCFVWIRAKEDTRWDHAVHLNRLFAVRCRSCGKTSTSFNGPMCPMCGKTDVELLPPRQRQHAPLVAIAQAVGIEPELLTKKG